MHFKENAEIVTQKGKTIGRLDRVVVDPETEAVTHLIAKKGLMFTTDRVIPARDVEATTEENVVLKDAAKDPDAYPQFKETNYVSMGSLEEFQDRSSREAEKLLWYHTAVKMPLSRDHRPYPDGPDKPLFYKTKQPNIPENAVALKEGAAVLGVNGEKLGEIHNLFTEPEAFRITHILVASEWLRNDIKLIPASWINEISEDSVQLCLGKDTYKNVPHADSILDE